MEEIYQRKNARKIAKHTNEFAATLCREEGKDFEEVSVDELEAFIGLQYARGL
jgi:hypothetical protein